LVEIRDPIHGNIDINEFEKKIIDTPEMQRLRYMKQLDLSYLVFPGANHSRFEHSLGTMQVTKEISNKVYDDEPVELPYIGLLHDIGHGAFSHLTEVFIKKYLKIDHERMGEEKIRNSQIKDILVDAGVSFKKVIRYFRDPYSVDIVGGALGSDRLDYLMRDSHYTGVAYGIIDYERLKSRLVLKKNKVMLFDSGVPAGESILIARYFMHSNVYAHHAKIIAAKMLQRSIESALESRAITVNDIIDSGDERFINKLISSGNNKSKILVKRIFERNLFKRAYYKNIESLINIKELEKEIIAAGIEKDGFVTHMITYSGGNDDIDVVDSKGSYIGKLTELSPLMKTLMKILTNSKTLLVATDKKNIEKVNSIVKRFVE
jgi:uncharacterized protein